MQFLLIHGGWQGGWCWDGVVRELERRGHVAVAPTLPGLEPDAKDRSGVGLWTFIRYITGELVSRDMTDVVIVGHSGGGSVAQGVAEAIVERIRAIVFMSARVLRHGESILDLGDPERRNSYERRAAATGDNTVPMSEDLWLRLCSDTSEEETRAWLPRVVPNPMGWLTEPAVLPTAAWRTIPSAYIFLDGENPRAKAFYAQMAARLPEPRFTHCPGGHEAMLSQPAAVADAILRAAAGSS